MWLSNSRFKKKSKRSREESILGPDKYSFNIIKLLTKEIFTTDNHTVLLLGTGKNIIGVDYFHWLLKC